MVLMTRRLFLIGSAAAIAATQIPFVQPVEAVHVYKVRRILDISAYPGAGEVPVGASQMMEAKIWRSGFQSPIFHQFFSSMNSMRWVAAPGDAIELLADESVRLELTGGMGIGRIDMGVDDDGELYREEHTFPSKGPARIIPLFARGAA